MVNTCGKKKVVKKGVTDDYKCTCYYIYFSGSGNQILFNAPQGTIGKIGLAKRVLFVNVKRQTSNNSLSLTD